MKKFIATLMLLAAATAAFAGKTADSDGAIGNPKSNWAACHDADGKWNPTQKDCDPYACGCLFHQIGDFILEIFI